MIHGFSDSWNRSRNPPPFGLEQRHAAHSNRSTLCDNVEQELEPMSLRGNASGPRVGGVWTFTRLKETVRLIKYNFKSETFEGHERRGKHGMDASRASTQLYHRQPVCRIHLVGVLPPPSRVLLYIIVRLVDTTLNENPICHSNVV
jgi:hypothetical protein